jgi:hypothetical protein
MLFIKTNDVYVIKGARIHSRGMVAPGVGWATRRFFAADIGDICKKTNAVDRPSQVITNRAE